VLDRHRAACESLVRSRDGEVGVLPGGRAQRRKKGLRARLTLGTCVSACARSGGCVGDGAVPRVAALQVGIALGTGEVAEEAGHVA